MNFKYLMRVLGGASFQKMGKAINTVHEKSGKSKFTTFFDMLGCSLRYGAGYNDYIIFDEWDVMDGGCYANDSWAPVGYSAYERYLCGWLEPEALPDDASVSCVI